MNKLSIIIVTLFLFFTSCNTIKSSMAYTEGTQCLENRDYKNAIIQLEKAIALDPTVARNHINLCSAYAAVNNIPKAWVEARAAVLCKYKGDGTEELNFRNFYNVLIRNKLDQPGLPIDEITAQLGTPDSITHDECGNITILIYGNCKMTFISDELVECTLYK